MEELKFDLNDLKPGERFEVPASQETVAELELLYLKMNSYQNLFASFMEKSVEGADEFSLQKFLDAYTELTVKEYFLSKFLIEPIIGEDGFNALRCPQSKINVEIDNYNKKLFIKKEACDCSTCNPKQEQE